MDAVRRPRMTISINGNPTSACVDATITSARSFEAGSFNIGLNAVQAERDLGLDWCAADETSVAISVRLNENGALAPGAAAVTLMNGMVDTVTFDPAGSRFTLVGRDRAAGLIDRPIADAYLNRTSSEIARTLASECGLQSVVQQTTTLVGQYYQFDRSKSSLSIFSRHGNAWDLLVELAAYENFDLWVKETTLYFLPARQSDATIAVHYDSVARTYVSENIDILDMQVERNCQLDQDVQVIVKGWNSRQKTIIAASHPQQDAGPSRSFVVVKPNLLLDEAQSLAISTYERIARHRKVLSCSMVGELNLTARTAITVSGVSPLWDGLYAVDRLVRRFSLRSGYTQRVVARMLSNEDGYVDMA